LAGASLSLSGSLSVQGVQAHRGLKLWATSAGADGIVVGEAKRRVELVVFDDESKSARARRNTQKLLEEGGEILFSPTAAPLKGVRHHRRAARSSVDLEHPRLNVG